jgi:hypothetical protein
MQGGATQSQVASAVSKAKLLTSDLHYGRIDLSQGVKAGRSLWPSAPYSAVPASCASDSIDWTEAP